MKPQTHMFRSGGFRPNLVTRIFEIDLVFLQVRQRFSQGGHIRQMEGHMVESLGRWFAFKQGDGDIVVSDGNAVLKVKFLAQPQGPLKPAGTLLRIAYRQAEVSDHTENKGRFHSAKVSIYIKGTDGQKVNPSVVLTATPGRRESRQR